jgi:hypothetical protein
MFQRLDRIARAKDDLSSVSGLEGVQLRGGLDDSVLALRDANVYPPLLLKLVQQFVDGGPGSVHPEFELPVDASECERLSVQAACELLGLDVVKSAARPLTTDERIAKAVNARVAPLSARIYQLGKEIAQFKAEATQRGARFE